MNFSESVYVIEVICTLVGIVIGSVATYFYFKNHPKTEEKSKEIIYAEVPKKKRKVKIEPKELADAKNLNRAESEAKEMVEEQLLESQNVRDKLLSDLDKAEKSLESEKGGENGNNFS